MGQTLHDYLITKKHRKQPYEKKQKMNKTQSSAHKMATAAAKVLLRCVARLLEKKKAWTDFLRRGERNAGI